MKILIVSSQFGKGGYGWHCEDMSQILLEQAHSIKVLTCQDQQNKHSNIPVMPLLIRDPQWGTKSPGYLQFFLYRKKRESHNKEVVLKTLEDFKPDIIFIWQAIGLQRSLLKLLEESIYPVVYRFCDYWPTIRDEYWAYWEKPSGRFPYKFIMTLKRQSIVWILSLMCYCRIRKFFQQLRSS